jgi:hypothetical protein
MFNFFKSDKQTVKVVDKVWMYQHAKHKACIQMLEHSKDNCLFIAWFEDTYKTLQQTLQIEEGESTTLQLAHYVTIEQAQNKMIVFVEHYPLTRVEQDLFITLNLKDVPVLSSLDEPFFQQFGGEKTIELMKKLGMNEDEIIGHSLVSKSIINAQRSIEKKVPSEIKSKSQHDWFAVNIR